MAQGTYLNKAMDWFNRAVKLEAEGKQTMMDKCIEKMIEAEKAGIAAGESWD